MRRPSHTGMTEPGRAEGTHASAPDPPPAPEQNRCLQTSRGLRNAGGQGGTSSPVLLGEEETDGRQGRAAGARASSGALPLAGQSAPRTPTDLDCRAAPPPASPQAGQTLGRQEPPDCRSEAGRPSTEPPSRLRAQAAAHRATQTGREAAGSAARHRRSGAWR